MKRAAGLAGSVLLHVGLVLALLSATGKAGAPPGHLGETELQLIDDAKKLRAAAEPLPTVAVSLAPIGRPAALETPCLGPSYHGIGVRRYFGGGIFEVAPGSPAARAGMQIDDVLLNDEVLVVNGYPDGTRLAIRVQRGERELTLIVYTGEICEDR